MTVLERQSRPRPAQPPSPAPLRRSATRRHWVAGLALSVASASMLVVMWDGLGNLWPLVMVAFVPMYVAQYRLLPRRASGLAVAIAAAGYWWALWHNTGAVLGTAAVLGLTVACALIWFGLASLERPFAERTGFRWFLLQFPVLWVALEVVFESNPLVGTNIWIAYRLAAVPELVQAVSWFSTPALALVILVFNAAVALLVLRWIDSRWPHLATVPVPKRAAVRGGAIGIAAAVIWVVISLVINTQVTSQLGEEVRVASVQTGKSLAPGGGSSLVSAPMSPADNAARNEKLTAELTDMTDRAANEGAQLVVWPEIILDYDVFGAEGDWVRELAADRNVTIVVGYEPDYGDPAAANLAAVVLPSGEMSPDPYYKVHPVVAEGEAFETPQVYPVHSTPFGELGVIICFDHDHPNSSARLETLVGAQIMAVPALDTSSISNLRWESLTFRAIENRIPMVKSDLSWDAAIVNANGSLVDRVAFTNTDGGSALLVGDVNIGPRNAPFTVTGDYWLAVLVLGVLATRYVLQFRSRHSGATGPTDQRLDSNEV